MERIIFLLIGLAINTAILISERFFETTPTIRASLCMALAISLCSHIGFWILKKQQKHYWQHFVIWSTTAFISFTAYWVWDASELTETMQILLFTIWSSLSLLNVFMTLGLLSQTPHIIHKHDEPLRFHASLKAWHSVALLAVIMGAINWSAHQIDFQTDLTYSKTALPSDDTRNLLDSQEGLKATAFFPKEHEIGQRVESYFELLPIDFSLLDKDEDLDAAHQLHINRNGFLVITKHKQQPQYIDIGLQHHQAMATLRNLDQKVQAKIHTLVSPAKTAYMTQGHGEVPLRGGKHPITGITTFKSWITSQNYKLKPLSLHEGLSQSIPEDADLIIIAGARSPFLQGEVSALETWVTKGGKLWIWLDPLSGENDPLAQLLYKFGIKTHNEILSHPTKHLTASAQARQNKTMIFTQRVLQHPSVQRFFAHKDQTNFFAHRSGWLEIHDEGDQSWDAEILIQTLPGTQTSQDQNSSNKNFFGLSAVAWRGDSKVSVLSNTASLGDLFLRNPANAMYASDTLSWLSGAPTHLSNSEEDVRIQHSGTGERIWFYGTTTVVPLFILICGWFATRRRKRSEDPLRVAEVA
ncbi:MAG: Gldg family protein [Oligoflexales bacterium]